MAITIPRVKPENRGENLHVNIERRIGTRAAPVIERFLICRCGE